MVNGAYKMMDPSAAPTGATEVGVIGLFYGGGMSQFWAETVGVVTCFVTLSILSIIVYKIVDVTIGNRVSEETEIEGLDIPEMGVLGYSGMVADKSSETPHARIPLAHGAAASQHGRQCEFSC